MPTEAGSLADLSEHEFLSSQRLPFGHLHNIHEKQSARF